MEFKTSQTSTSNIFVFPSTTTATLTYKNDILSTFAARFGFAADHALLYAEYAATDMITLKAEYNYLDFGTKNETLTLNMGALPLTATISDKLTMNVVKVGVNILFH
jgi:hypothetical protein